MEINNTATRTMVSRLSSQPYPLLALYSSYLTFLSLNFLFCKMRTVVVLTFSGGCEDYMSY